MWESQIQQFRPYIKKSLPWTTTQNGQNKWTKIVTLETTIFGLKMMVKSGLDFFFFEILHAPSEIPANLAGQFSRSGQIFFALGSHNSEWGTQDFKIKYSRPFFTIIFLSQKQSFQELRFQSTYFSHSRWCVDTSYK